MAIHAVRHKSLRIVDMCRSLPGVVSELDLMARGTKAWRRGADHGVVGHAEQRKCDENAENNKDNSCKILFHNNTLKIISQKFIGYRNYPSAEFRESSNETLKDVREIIFK